MKRMALAGKSTRSSASSRDRGTSPPRKTAVVALCTKRGQDCGDLHLATLYVVIPDKEAAKEGYLRVIDDSGEYYLYPADYFVLRRLPVALLRKIRQQAK
jgi:hypothetical protein